MATSETTNLQLVKYGAGTDNFIRTDYNGNLDKIDTFAGNTNEAIANLAKTISSGSLHDIMSSGLYYVTNAVTDKPTSTGGYYAVSTNGAVVSGIYVQNLTGSAFSVTYNGTSWIYQQLALKNDYATTTAITLDNDGNGTISYPSGFTTANCFVESIKVDLSGNVYSDHPNFVALQRSGDIRVGCGNNFAGASVVALLHKI